jgi:hypothetical protein
LAIELIENAIGICTDPGVAELGDSQRSVTREPESFGHIIDPEAQGFFPCARCFSARRAYDDHFFGRAMQLSVRYHRPCQSSERDREDTALGHGSHKFRRRNSLSSTCPFRKSYPVEFAVRPGQLMPNVQTARDDSTERSRLEKALEIGLEDTFPASDAVAVVQPTPTA